MTECTLEKSEFYIPIFCWWISTKWPIVISKISAFSIFANLFSCKKQIAYMNIPYSVICSNIKTGDLILQIDK